MRRLSGAVGATAVLGALAFAHATTPAAAPEVFEPGVISGPAHDSAPAFSPDGRELYFTRSSSAMSVIMVSHRLAQGWSEPGIAPFSGAWLEMEPAFSPDGRFLVYASNRPDDGGTAPIDGFFNGVPRPGKGARLWRVDRLPTGWSRPRLLPPEINDGHAIYAPSVTRDGSLYFMKPGADGRFQIFRAQADGAGFKPAERAPFNEAGAASGVISVMQRVGSAIGIAVIGSVLFGTLHITSRDPAQIQQAFVDSAAHAMAVSAALSIVAFALVFVLPRKVNAHGGPPPAE